MGTAYPGAGAGDHCVFFFYFTPGEFKWFQYPDNLFHIGKRFKRGQPLLATFITHGRDYGTFHPLNDMGLISQLFDTRNNMVNILFPCRGHYNNHWAAILCG
ncbi:MAG: hypothetical protein BWX80_04137 [Candidatus Hydrogenedentes bacterium ADurb.Bin101]|nr:MAG: hypothetical protein BWX80_04137 [Candidatus Hydrogenedentes bacterium ADurb.Bin101]